MSIHRLLQTGDILPESWLTALQQFLGAGHVNFKVEVTPNGTGLQVPAGADNQQAALAINGKWRYNAATVTAAMPGGANVGWNDVYVTGSDNAFSGSPEVDSTIYTFGLAIVPTGTPATALYRKVGRAQWDGTRIIGYEPMVGASDGVGPLALHATAPGSSPLRIRGAAAQTAPLVALENATGTAVVTVDAGGGATFSGAVTAQSVDAASYLTGGAPLDAAHLGNGVTGAGAIVLNASPSLTGTPTGPTAAVDTNSVQLATTAFVANQASGTAPLMNGVAGVGSSLRYARADHTHPSDTSRAPLASPTFTGAFKTATGSTLGFFGAAAVARSVGYGALGEATSNGIFGGLNAGSTLYDVIRTVTRLVADLRTYGLIGA